MNKWLLISYFSLLALLAVIIAIYPLKKKRHIGVWLGFPFLLIAVMALSYQHWGAWLQWRNFTQEEAQKIKAKALLATMKSPNELAEKLKSRLTNRPESARGWYLLGRIYVGQNQWESARDAFEKSHQLNPDDEMTTINYAYSLWQLNQQHFTKEITTLFKGLLIKNPNQPDALAMLAMNAYEHKNYRQAEQYWRQLLVLAPSNSKESRALRKAIAQAKKMQQSK